MKAIVALLLGLAAVVYGTSEEAFSLESDSADDSSTSLGGLKVRVFLNTGEEGVPQVVLGSSLDNEGHKYCLNIEGVFEALNYTLTDSDGNKCSEDCEYVKVEDSETSLGDASCTATALSDSSFEVKCTGIEGATLTLTFSYLDNDGDTGLEYTIVFTNYTFISDDPDAKLVLEQSLVSCKDTRGSDSDDDDDSDDDTDTDTDTDDESIEGSSTTDEPDRRRLEEEEEDEEDSDTGDENSDSLEEGDGVSSDDSRELDVGYSSFILTNPTARDVCDDGEKNVTVNLVFFAEDDEIHLVIDRFECELQIDPWLGFSVSKLDGAATLSCTITMLLMAVYGVFFV